MLHSICQQTWKTQQWPQDWKQSVFLPIPKKGNVKECSNYCTTALISCASKVMLKILQVMCQQYVNCELPDVQAGFRKGRGTRDQIANIHWIIKKAREFQKNIYFCFIEYTIALDCVDHKKFRKFLRRWEYQTTWPASWEICMQVKNQQLEQDMEQTGSKYGKEYLKAYLILVYCHPAYLTYMQSTSCEMPGWNQDWREMGIQTSLLASWEICVQVKKQQLELDMKQQIGSESEKDYVKAVFWHSAYLTYMQNRSCDMLGWRKHKLESRLPGEISITSDMHLTPPLWQKTKRNWRASW